MTEEERFSFDRDGYGGGGGVHPRDDTAALLAIALANRPPEGDGAAYRRAFGTLSWDPACRALMDHPKIVPYLIELIGPKFRLDHDYCIFMSEGARDQDLHGGETIHNPDHWYAYRDGTIRCGLTVVEFCLTPADSGDGGFCCIPGSHKSNFAASVPRDVRSYERVPHYVVQPRVMAGDAIIFTEALIHGTLPWTADHERVTLLYKYSPGHSAWMKEYYDPARYPDLTEQQKRILAPPSVGGRDDSVPQSTSEKLRR
jgi:hypothetical protein